jgi:serine/threonine-protein kinase RsbT
MSTPLVEQRLIEVLAGHVSRINARVIVERARRVLSDPDHVAPEERERYLGAIRFSARLFTNAQQLEAICRALVDLDAELPPPLAVAVRVEQDLRAARLAARDLCQQLGAPSFMVHRVATAVSELARNIVSYTPGGQITLSPRAGPPPTLQILAEDRGPGIPHLDAVLGGRYRSRTGLGLGLRGVRQLMERFDVHTGPAGTRISMEARLR